MTTLTGSGYRLSGKGTLSCATPTTVGTTALANDLSGITFEQAAPLAAQNDFIDLTDEFVFQTFRLPSNYPRGTGSAVRIPELTGLQVNVGVPVGFTKTAALDWRIDYFSQGWIGLVAGTKVGVSADGTQVWFNINFTPTDITNIWSHTFRFGIRGRSSDITEQQDIPLNFDGKSFSLNDTIYSIVPHISSSPLIPGRAYPFTTVEGVPSIVTLESGILYYSTQMGVDRVWYNAPNPLAVNGFKAYEKDGVNPIQDTGADVSLRFRILSAAPDTDLDSFGNDYRTRVTSNPPTNVENSSINLRDAFWLSKPNPSKFAVEALYFDLTDHREAVVLDHMLVDPVTPGVRMNIYYSNDPLPGTDTATWDNLLWAPIGQTFLLRRRETLAFPDPVIARYVKLEFTHLQPRHYAPGVLQLPLTYTKHPKWVLDHSLAIYQQRRANEHEFSRRVNVTYDALDLAYSYFLDDLRLDSPNAPTTIRGSKEVSLVKGFLADEASRGNNQIDADTLLRIKNSFKPFVTNPFAQGRFGEILAEYAMPRTDLFTNYSTEAPVTPIATTDTVSSLDRESLVIERNFPTMSFYLPCRHRYKQTLGRFDQDRAYFAGLKEVAFSREHYASVFDHPQYNESAGDNINMDRNDFVTVDQTWKTFSSEDPNPELGLLTIPHPGHLLPGVDVIPGGDLLPS